MSLMILPADEIDYIITVSDFILKFPNLSVGDIKKTFRLTSEEYETILNLCGFKEANKSNVEGGTK